MMKKVVYALIPALVLLMVLTAFSASVLATEDENAASEPVEDVVVQSAEEEVTVIVDAVIVETAAEEQVQENDPQETVEAAEAVQTEEEETVEETTEATESAEPAETEEAETEPVDATEPVEETDPATDSEETETEIVYEEVKNPVAAQYMNMNFVQVDEQGNLYSSSETFALRIPSYLNGKLTSTIVDNGFYGWNQLTVVVVPKNITYIGNNAFAGCANLRVIVLEGRADACDMMLGSGWNGNAEVIYELISQQVESVDVQAAGGNAE